MLFQVKWAEQQVVKRRVKRDHNFNDPKWPRMWYLWVSVVKMLGKSTCMYFANSQLTAYRLVTRNSHIRSVLSVRGGEGGCAPVEGVWWAGCDARMKVDMKHQNRSNGSSDAAILNPASFLLKMAM